MSKIISVVPNISEGMDRGVIDAIVDKLHGVKDLIVLDVSRDTSRNRTVISFTGTPKTIFEGGFVLYEESLKHIDMRRHEGAYPRIGAVDVFPFVPLRGYTIKDAVDLSVEFAEKVAERFRIPVYLFGESARVPTRRHVEHIREGEYEGLAEKLKDPLWRPDFGPVEFNPDSGATCIGARYPLISFKVDFTTEDEEVVSNICQEICKLPHVRAYAGRAGAAKHMQVTITITNYRSNPMYRVLEAIRTECRRYGLNITKVQMIGLIPEIAFVESALYYMNIHRFEMDRLLERSIQEHLADRLPNH